MTMFSTSPFSSVFRGAPCALALLLCLLGAGPLGADEIRMKTGKVLKGEILTSDTHKVFIRVEGASLGISRAQIADIQLSSGAERSLTRGWLDIQSGKVVEGLETWRTALAADEASVEPLLSRMLAERSESLSKAAGGLASGEQPRALAVLDMLAGRSTLPMEGKMACIRALAAMGATSAVSRHLAPLDPNALRAEPSWREFAVRFWREEIRRKQSAQEFAAALHAVEMLRALDPESGQTHEALVLLAQIGDARREGHLTEALRLSTGELARLLPEVARLRTEQLLGSLGAWVGEEGAPDSRFEDARDFLEHSMMRTQPLEAEAALARLFEVRGRALLADGRVSDTLRLLDSAPILAATDPGLKELSLEAKYRSRRAALAAADPLGHYHLGLWAAQQGRPDWALAELQECQGGIVALEKLARQQMELVRGRVDREALQRAIDLYKEDRMMDALESLDPVLKGEQPGVPTSPFKEQAIRLADLIRQTLESEKEKRPYQAEVLYQQAERSYYAADFGSALRDLGDVLREFGETPAASRAERLLPRVLRSIELMKMEGAAFAAPPVPADLLERVGRMDPSRLDMEIRKLLDSLQDRALGVASPTPVAPPPQ